MLEKIQSISKLISQLLYFFGFAVNKNTPNKKYGGKNHHHCPCVIVVKWKEIKRNEQNPLNSSRDY